MFHSPEVQVRVNCETPRLSIDFIEAGFDVSRRHTILGTDVIVKQVIPWNRVFLEGLVIPQAVLKFPHFRDPAVHFRVYKARLPTVSWTRLTL
jgi:hypothetical protein